MFNRLVQFQQKHPFLSILMIAFTLRLIAVFFSKGYSIFNEHFLYVEMPSSWLNDIEYNSLLTDVKNTSMPRGTSLFYVSINYIIFGFLKFFGITNPPTIMFFSRLIHAVISLFVVSFGYRIASLLSKPKIAYIIALLLAVYWFMPYVSVHNLATFICVPFLMYGTLVILNQEIIRKNNLQGYHRSSIITGGFFLGLGFSIWFQSILFLIGIELALLISKNWKGSVLCLGGILLAVVIAQGIPDLIVWHRPFAELGVFLTSGSQHIMGNLYTPWFYSSILLLVFGLIIPVSVMLFYGYFKTCIKHYLISIPVLFFIVYYTIFPTRQNFFILPVIPFFIILGCIGWFEHTEQSSFWKQHTRLHKYLWGFSGIINLAILVVMMPLTLHRSEINAMNHLNQYDNLQSFVIEDITNKKTENAPLFYSEFKAKYATINQGESMETGFAPQFVLFYEEKDMAQRLENMKQIYPNLVYETRLNPSVTAIFINWLNKNKNDDVITIYRNADLIPQKHD